MNNFKEKSQVFIVGVMVGLIVAGGFFILKLDNYFKELKFYKRVSKTFSHDSKYNETLVKIEDTTATPIKEKKQVDYKIKNKKILTSDASKKNNFVLDADTLSNYSLKDSIHMEVYHPDDIVVRKDELLLIKTLEVINLSPVASSVNTKDSLLHKVSGVNEDRLNAKQFFNIELWQSPLHYRGYKMSKYKLVLYGVASADAIKLFKSEDVIYMKNLGMVYRLDYANDFKPYERITDETIISKLK